MSQRTQLAHKPYPFLGLGVLCDRYVTEEPITDDRRLGHRLICSEKEGTYGKAASTMLM